MKALKYKNNYYSVHWGIMKLSTGLVTLLFSIAITTNGTFAAKLDTQRDQFDAVYKKIKQGKSTRTSHLKDYPLYPYLEYEKIRRNLKSTSEKTLLTFIDNYKNTPLADELWSHWLSRLAHKKKWEKIVAVYSPLAADTSAKCYYLEALMHKGNKEAAKSARHDAIALWMSAKSRPKACNSLFAQLKKSRSLSKEKYWQRIELAVDKGNSKLARGLVKYLPKDEQNIARQYVVSHRSPQKALKSKYLGSGQYSRKVIAHAVKRIARKNYKKGYRTWKKYKNKYAFSDQKKHEVEAYLAVRASFNHDKGALHSFSKIPAKYRNDEANIWMARMALREGKWGQLNQAIDAMGEEVAQQDIWQYWKARASEKTGDTALAETLFHKLSENATFYGFLSADHLNKSYKVFDKHNQSWENCAENVQIVSPVFRAMEWFKLGKDSLAYKEWFWALKHMNKDGKLAAAALALKLEKPILAVRSVAKTKDWNQVGLRFPLLYKKLITEMSGKNEVNPAWVYGIMRRESVFNKGAVSGARAMGLMQLLPSTARDVGRKLGLAKVRKSDLLTPKLNIKLGSAYLSSMLDDFNGSYVKATAGYNAGPSRSVKWTPDKTIEADRWVESIPFRETRKYVRAVMAYTTIYDHKLTDGKGMRISDRLKPVKSRSIN